MAMRIIRFALPLDTFRLVNSYDTTKRLWDRLNELYFGDDDLKHSLQTNLVLLSKGQIKIWNNC